MGVNRQTIVAVFEKPVVKLTRGIGRIEMNYGVRQITQMMHQLVPHLHRNLVSLFNRKLRADRHIQLGVQAVPQPAHPHIGHAFYLGYVASGVLDLIDHLRLNPIQQPGENSLGRLPHNAKDSDGND